MVRRLNMYSIRKDLPVVNAHATAALKKEAKRDSRPAVQAENVIRIAGLYGHNPKQNHLLAALPPEDYDRLVPGLEMVSMQFGATVFDAGMQMQHVYFP